MKIFHLVLCWNKKNYNYVVGDRAYVVEKFKLLTARSIVDFISRFLITKVLYVFFFNKKEFF